MDSTPTKNQSSPDWPERLAAADKKVLVLAGDNKEFIRWCRDKKRMPGVDAVFLKDERAARGLKPEEWRVVKIGSYGSRRDLHTFDWVLQRFPG